MNSFEVQDYKEWITFNRVDEIDKEQLILESKRLVEYTQKLEAENTALKAQVEELESDLITYQDIAQEKLIQSWRVLSWFQSIRNISNVYDTPQAKLLTYEQRIDKIIQMLQKDTP